jgi:hypothetical protein
VVVKLQIFTNVFPVDYSPPDGFGFEVLDENILPVQVHVRNHFHAPRTLHASYIEICRMTC